MLLKKRFTNLKTDVSDQLFSNLKRVGSIKKLIPDLVYTLKKKSIRFSKRLSHALGIANRLKLSNVGLNFRAKNSRNVFIRIKRKSSYGKTLLEKQKLQAYTPSLTHSRLKKLFCTHKEKLPSLVERLPAQILNRTRFFGSAASIAQKVFYHRGVSVEKTFSFGWVDFKLLKQDSLQLPFLGFRKKERSKKRKTLVFDRPLPSHMVTDLRLFKARVLSNETSFSYPFRFDGFKLVQHFRLKRS